LKQAKKYLTKFKVCDIYGTRKMKIPKMLRELMKKEGATLIGTARALGIDHASLLRSLKDTANPEARTIERILDYLGYEIKFVRKKKKRRV